MDFGLDHQARFSRQRPCEFGFIEAVPGRR
jgi:hypothetical protein